MGCFFEKNIYFKKSICGATPKSDMVLYPKVTSFRTPTNRKSPTPFLSNPLRFFPFLSVPPENPSLSSKETIQVRCSFHSSCTSQVQYLCGFRGFFCFVFQIFAYKKRAPGFFTRHSFRKSFSMMFSILRRAVFQSISCQFSVQRHNKHYIPACFATSAAKSSWRFSMPSPVSQRRKLLMVIFAPFSFATCSTYLLTGCLPSSAFTYT